MRSVVVRHQPRRLFSSGIQKLNRMHHAAAPSPESLPKSRAPMGKWRRRALVLGGVGLVVYGYDRFLNASAWARAGRCVRDLLIVGFDYKFNFKEGHDIDALHERSADRLYNMMIKNKGLYIKMGQAVAVQAGLFPPSFQEKFGQLFDSAPQDTWHQVEKLLKEEYNEAPDSVFEFIDHRAIASASIAQVHKAKLKTGEWVAVKVQHSDLKQQVGWDLAAYKWLMWIYDRYLFKMPLYFVAEHIAERLQREVNFTYELENAESTRNSIAADSQLRAHCYVPENYPQLCTGRVLVSEWIDGVALSKAEEVKRQGFNTGDTMKWLIKLFGRQMYSWGMVHCDPHPGNVLLRRVNGRQQLVLIDHGLYIVENEKFRNEYASLWEAMFTADNEQLRKVTAEWGFGDADILASTTMMQSYQPSGKKNVSPQDHELSRREEFKQHEKMRDKMRNFLQDTKRIPLELIFLGRTMRIIQGLNRKFGSPVNRIKLFSVEASYANQKRTSQKSWLRALRDYFVFWGILVASDVGFWLIRARQLLFGSSLRGAEDFIEDQMKKAAQDMGFDYQEEELV